VKRSAPDVRVHRDGRQQRDRAGHAGDAIASINGGHQKRDARKERRQEVAPVPQRHDSGGLVQAVALAGLEHEQERQGHRQEQQRTTAAPDRDHPEHESGPRHDERDPVGEVADRDLGVAQQAEEPSTGHRKEPIGPDLRLRGGPWQRVGRGEPTLLE